MYPGILEYIENSNGSGQPANSEEFEALLPASDAEEFARDDLDRILAFVSDQSGNWFSRWALSSQNQPDIDAQAEFDNWELLWRAFAQYHIKYFPDQVEAITRRHRARREKCALEYRMRGVASKPLTRLATGTLSRLAIVTDHLGLKRVAKQLYSWSLYPKGSVGRG